MHENKDALGCTVCGHEAVLKCWMCFIMLGSHVPEQRGSLWGWGRRPFFCSSGKEAFWIENKTECVDILCVVGTLSPSDREVPLVNLKQGAPMAFSTRHSEPWMLLWESTHCPHKEMQLRTEYGRGLHSLWWNWGQVGNAIPCTLNTQNPHHAWGSRWTREAQLLEQRQPAMQWWD